jgi:hypothetical protein
MIQSNKIEYLNMSVADETVMQVQITKYEPEEEQDALIEKSCKLLAFKVGNLIDVCEWASIDLELLGIR